MWQRTWMIMWKEFKQISRDPRLLIVVIMLPVVMLVLYGYAINLDVKHVRMAVYDQSRTSDSRDIIGAFTRGEYFDVVEDVGSFGEVYRALDSGEAKIGLVIPYDFSKNLAQGRRATILLLVDASDSTTASTANGYSAAIVQQYSSRIAVQALRREGVSGAVTLAPVDNRARFLYNPELKSTNFIIPGLMAIILMMLGTLLTSVTIVRERERGTIEQLIVSPVRPIELMLGKLMPYVLIAFGDVLLIMGVGAVFFRIPMAGSPLLLMAMAGIFVTAALGIGLVFSTVAPNQQVAMFAAMMATQLPSVLLSGFIFPIRNMPLPIQWFTSIIPATHFIHITRGIYMKGQGIEMLWRPALFLLAIGIVMLVICVARFKKKL